MAEFKLVLSDPKTGKSIQREAKDMAAKSMIGKKIGDAVKGESFDLPGYEFVITGGSDFAGFPMRPDVLGAARKKITAVKGVGVHNKLRKPNPKKKGWRKMKGMRLKKTVAGNTIHDKTAQVNMKITKNGREPLFSEAPAAEAKPEGAEKKEEKPKQATPVAEEKPKAAEKKEAPDPVAEAKPVAAEKKEEKPKAEPKKKAEPKVAPENTEKLAKEAEALEDAAKKDEEEVAEEDEEIDKLDEELKKVDKDLEE